MKFNTGYYGGSMKALEGYYKKHQILISDGDGGLPLDGKPYTIGVFKKDGDDWACEASKRIDRKVFKLDRAIEQAKKLVNGKIKL